MPPRHGRQSPVRARGCARPGGQEGAREGHAAGRRKRRNRSLGCSAAGEPGACRGGAGTRGGRVGRRGQPAPRRAARGALGGGGRPGRRRARRRAASSTGSGRSSLPIRSLRSAVYGTIPPAEQAAAPSRGRTPAGLGESGSEARGAASAGKRGSRRHLGGPGPARSSAPVRSSGGRPRRQSAACGGRSRSRRDRTSGAEVLARSLAAAEAGGGARRAMRSSTSAGALADTDDPQTAAQLALDLLSRPERRRALGGCRDRAGEGRRLGTGTDPELARQLEAHLIIAAGFDRALIRSGTSIWIGSPWTCPTRRRATGCSSARSQPVTSSSAAGRSTPSCPPRAPWTADLWPNSLRTRPSC